MVQVMSRSKAIQYCHRSHEQESVMISISDPNMEYPSAPFATEENGIKAILRLSFCDADRPGKDVYGVHVTEQDLFNDGHAQQVANFLRAHPNEDVIVHCDAGISRSAGLAAAILKHTTGDDGQIFDSWLYHPNMRVYRKTLETLHNYNDGTKEAI